MFNKIISRVAVVIATVAILSFMIGCNSDKIVETPCRDNVQMAFLDPLFTTMLPSCTIDVLSTSLDTLSKEITLSLIAHYGAGESFTRTLSLQFYDSQPSEVGYIATLTDDLGRLQFQFGCAVDTLDDNDFRFFEKTQIDSMTVNQYWSDHSFSEMYTINDQQQGFHFRTSDVEKIHVLFEQMLLNEGKAPLPQVAGVTDLEKEIVSVLRDFREFYETDNTLHGNRDGFLVSELLTSDELADWIKDRYAEKDGSTTPMACRPRWGDYLCGGAAVCSGLKCAAGFAANPGCNVCLAAGLTCVVMDVFNLW